MSGMFENFDEKSHISNRAYSLTDYNFNNNTYIKPYEEYDNNGNIICYYWNYGDSINLSFSLSGEITVDSDAIIYNIAGQYPDKTTVANINSKAYNVIDLKSWTLVSIENNNYNWV
mgnify:CR=1 FL=1